jgi:hypothetical protein
LEVWLWCPREMDPAGDPVAAAIARLFRAVEVRENPPTTGVLTIQTGRFRISGVVATRADTLGHPHRSKKGSVVNYVMGSE